MSHVVRCFYVSEYAIWVGLGWLDSLQLINFSSFLELHTYFEQHSQTTLKRVYPLLATYYVPTSNMTEFLYCYTPGPGLMRIHLVRNSTSASYGKNPKYSLMRIYSTTVNCVLSKMYSVQNLHEVTKALVEYFCIIEYSLSAKLS